MRVHVASVCMCVSVIIHIQLQILKINARYLTCCKRFMCSKQLNMLYKPTELIYFCI